MAVGKWKSLANPLGAGLLVALLVVALLPGPASASRLEQQKRDTERRLQGVGGELDSALDELSQIEGRHARTSAALAEVEQRISDIETRITELTGALDEARAELAAAEQALRATEEEMADTEERLDETRGELAGQRDVFSARVRGAYMRSNLSMATAVLDARDLSEVTRATRFVEAFVERDVEQMERMWALQSRIEQSVVRLGELRERREGERQAAEDERDRMAGLVDEQKQLQAEAAAEAETRRKALAQIEEDEAKYERLVASLESESSTLESRLAKIAAEERRIAEQKRQEEERRRQEAARQAQRQQVATSRSSSSVSTASTASTSTGKMLRPVPGPVTSGYGYRIHPIRGTRRLHTGIDFGSPSGTPIKAAESGTVVSAGGMGGYGSTVVINHGGGKSTLYAHQSRLAVSGGQTVSRGQTIGYVGSTGLSTGPHLHFEVRINGSPTNPSPYLW